MPYQPLVSIIIPTYNRAHLIGETLDSVLEQKYNHKFINETFFSNAI